MSIFGVLGVIFIVLKLVGVIHWSWWLVTLPITAWAAVVLLIVLVAAIATAVTTSRVSASRRRSW